MVSHEGIPESAFQPGTVEVIVVMQELPHSVDEWPREWRNALEGRATYIHKRSGYPLEEARGISEKIQRGRYRVGDPPLGVSFEGLPAALQP